ncbi:MAG: DUF2096 domain-containing protein, partial [Candidatus Bathyarchaeota archaeon]|nr:DUF2096 domain-containing protein [Candidatus Bathyarchaeota archaeon]
EEVWKTLNDLIIEFRKKGEVIPPEVMADLRAAKTLMHVLRADPTKIENVPTIEMYLGNVESHLIFAAQARFGSEFVNRWMKKLSESREKPDVELATETASKFVPGLPRGQRWVRVQVSEETPKEEIEELVKEIGLACKMQDDGYMLVYGEGEKLKLFVKKLASKLRALEEK